MKKWAIQLSGHQYDLEFLDQNHYSPDWSIVIDNKEYFLVSSTFNLMTDKHEVKKEAEKLIRSINGNAMLANNEYKPVEFAGISELDEHGKQIHKYIELTETIKFGHIYKPAVHIEGQSTSEDSNESKLMKSYNIIAENNNYFANAMNILSKGKNNLTWGDLYKIQEIITDSKKITEVLALCKISKREFRNFKLNCNSHESAGEESRHHLDRLTMDNPKFKMITISKNEAYQLIRTMLLKWAEILS